MLTTQGKPTTVQGLMEMARKNALLYVYLASQLLVDRDKQNPDDTFTTASIDWNEALYPAVSSQLYRAADRVRVTRKEGGKNMTYAVFGLPCGIVRQACAELRKEAHSCRREDLPLMPGTLEPCHATGWVYHDGNHYKLMVPVYALEKGLAPQAIATSSLWRRRATGWTNTYGGNFAEVFEATLYPFGVREGFATLPLDGSRLKQTHNVNLHLNGDQVVRAWTPYASVWRSGGFAYENAALEAA